MEQNKLTSVKLPPKLLDEFKILSIRTKVSFQKLAERATYLYLYDEEFRNKINNTLNTQVKE